MIRIFLLSSIFFITGCSAWKQRNVSIYEKNLAASEAERLPAEPTLERKRVDEVSSDSLLDRDGLSPAERALIDRENKTDEAKRQKRRDKMFYFWLPKRKK